MALRTYLPTLKLVARAVCTYINAHEAKIKEALGGGSSNLVDTANTACTLLVAAIDAIDLIQP